MSENIPPSDGVVVLYFLVRVHVSSLNMAVQRVSVFSQSVISTENSSTECVGVVHCLIYCGALEQNRLASEESRVALKVFRAAQEPGYSFIGDFQHNKKKHCIRIPGR